VKNNQYRSHSVGAAVAAAIVTTVLVASLVESFEPAQLLRFEGNAKTDPIVALDRRVDESAAVRA
jgi:hypothetical protein